VVWCEALAKTLRGADIPVGILHGNSDAAAGGA